ncbi:MAG: TonB family protein [Verrucomicrobiota bacterium]|nr:TonB family protein [Verrucomicrobiota bacterium]
MKARKMHYPSLSPTLSLKITLVFLSFGLTFLLFSILPAFGTIGQKSRSTIRLIKSPMLISVPPKKIKKSEKTKPQKIPDKKKVIKQKLHIPRENIFTPAPNSSLIIPKAPVQPGLGNISMQFNVASSQISRSEPVKAKNFTIGDLDVAPHLLVRTSPLYPFKAKHRGIEGFVDIEFIIEANGTTSNIRIIESQPVGVFDKSACNAVKHWRFSTPKKDGKSVKVLARQQIQFSLEN